MIKRIVAFILVVVSIFSLIGCSGESPYIEEDEIFFAVNGKKYQLGVTFGELLKNTDIDKGLIDPTTKLGGGNTKKLSVQIKSGNKRSTIYVVLHNPTASAVDFTGAYIEQIYVNRKDINDPNAITFLGRKLEDGVDLWNSSISEKNTKTTSLGADKYVWEKTIKSTKKPFNVILETKNGAGEFMMISKLGAQKIN